MRNLSGVFALVLLFATSTDCRAQGLSLIETCPEGLRALVNVSPELPFRGEYDYTVTVSFVVDVDGSVVAPRVKEWRANRERGGPMTAPPGFEAAIVAALSASKYEKRRKPCAATLMQRIVFAI